MKPAAQRASIAASNEDDEAIPALALRNAIMKIEDLLGLGITRLLIDELEEMGIELSDERESYFLHEIREPLDLIFWCGRGRIIDETNEKRARLSKLLDTPLCHF